jgi:hypothetical protein
MKKLLFIGILITVFVSLSAEIGWSGNIWPNSESFHVATEDITVYYQVWKEGVTDQPGQGADISATLYYQTDGEFIPLSMEYNTDVGNNDEYTVTIPAEELTEGIPVNFYCEAFDATDETYSYGTDQNDAGPFTAENPGIYYIGTPTQMEVTVTFQVDMSLVDEIGDVSVSGSFNDWAVGVDTLTDPDEDEIYTGDVVFPQGSNPFHNYKFVNGETYEDAIGNRELEIDDSSPTMVLDVVYFNNQDPADYTTQDVLISFYCDVSDSVAAGVVFDDLGINGNVPPLDWEFSALNNPLVDMGDNIWNTDILFPEGSWKYLEFKFARNGNDYEAPFDENHSVTIDDSGFEQTVNVTYGEMGPVVGNNSNLPQPTILLRNYPNPFNPQTTIYFTLPPNNYQGIIEIFNTKGQKIRTLQVNSNQNSITWQGRNKQGEPVGSGIYFYKLTSGSYTATSKMLLLK